MGRHSTSFGDEIVTWETLGSSAFLLVTVCESLLPCSVLGRLCYSTSLGWGVRGAHAPPIPSLALVPVLSLSVPLACPDISRCRPRGVLAYTSVLGTSIIIAEIDTSLFPISVCSSLISFMAAPALRVCPRRTWWPRRLRMWLVCVCRFSGPVAIVTLMVTKPAMCGSMLRYPRNSPHANDLATHIAHFFLSFGYSSVLRRCQRRARIPLMLWDRRSPLVGRLSIRYS